MKKLTLLIAAGLSFAPLLSQAGEPLELKPVPKEATSSNLNFYVATNFLFSVMPGVRWQSDHWGADVGIGIAPIGTIQSVNGSMLYYFNPQATTKHYLSLGVSSFPAFQRVSQQVDDFNNEQLSRGTLLEEQGNDISFNVRKVVPSVAYGFQKDFKSRGYLFMNFGFYGPVGVTIHSEQGSQTMQLPVPFINLGYAF